MIMEREPRFGNSLFIVVGLALIVRLFALNGGLWFDEIRLLTEFGSMDFGSVLTTYGSDNNHPLYTILSWLSIKSFGPESWALRLPALLFGLLSLLVLGHLAALVLGEKKALLVTFLTAISYHHVWFSTNARGYTALLFFTLAATYELICLLDDRGRERLLTYSFSLALATFVHATAIFVAFTHLVVVWFMTDRSRPRGILGLMLAGIFSLIFHSAILGEMYDFLLGGSGHAKVASEWTNPLWAIGESFRTFGIPNWLAFVAAATGGFFFAWGLKSLSKCDRRLPWLFFLPFVFGTLFMFALKRNIWPRFYFNLLGFFLIVAVLMMDTIAAYVRAKIPALKHVFVGFAAVAILAFLYILPPALTLPKQDFEGAADYLEEKEASGATVITLGLAKKPFDAWLDKPWQKIDTAEQMKLALESEGPIYAVDTLSTFLESRTPEIATLVKEHGKLVKAFPGTVGGGAVKVYLFD